MAGPAVGRLHSGRPGETPSAGYACRRSVGAAADAGSIPAASTSWLSRAVLRAVVIAAGPVATEALAELAETRYALVAAGAALGLRRRLRRAPPPPRAGAGAESRGRAVRAREPALGLAAAGRG